MYVLALLAAGIDFFLSFFVINYSWGMKLSESSPAWPKIRKR